MYCGAGRYERHSATCPDERRLYYGPAFRNLTPAQQFSALCYFSIIGAIGAMVWNLYHNHVNLHLWPNAGLPYALPNVSGVMLFLDRFSFLANAAILVGAVIMLRRKRLGFKVYLYAQLTAMGIVFLKTFDFSGYSTWLSFLLCVLFNLPGFIFLMSYRRLGKTELTQ